MNENLFKTVEAKTNVKKEDILNLAKMIQNEDLNKEENLRKLIKDVAILANKEITKEKEDKLVQTIKSNSGFKDLKM